MTKESRRPVPTILVDFKKNRIRIHQQTLELLGAPAYLRLLVNPDDGVIALQVCEASDVRAHRSGTEKQPIELYSRALLQQLRLCGHWGSPQIYRLNGILIPREGIAFFKIKDAIIVPRNQTELE